MKEPPVVLRWRFTSAAVILLAVVGSCWADYQWSFGYPGIWLVPLCVVLSVLAAAELLGLLRAQDHRPIGWVVHTGTLMVVLAACAPCLWKAYPADWPLSAPAWPLVALALALVLALIGEMLRYEKAGGVVVQTALTFFAISYIGLLMSFLAQLRLLGDNGTGLAALLSMVIVVKLSDIGAYTCGRLFGRHKLAPRLSPGKTVEGTVGGIVTACVASYLVFRFLVPALAGPGAAATPWWGWLSYGAIVCIAGMVGDLAESLLKRDADRKDSSTWLPGLGGVLDFMDSLLTAAPVSYLCWVWGLVG